MIFISYFIIVFTIIQLLIAGINFIFRPRFLKSGAYKDPFISVLIPARNEEFNIGNILSDLVVQDYQNIEIIVFNDLSTDKTAEIVSDYERRDKRIRLVNSSGLPKGWLGKNYACKVLSETASGEYLLFTDADVRIGRYLIHTALSYMEIQKISLLTIFPKQLMKTFGEKITVPNMNYILLSLLPLILVRKSKKSSLAAANGQFMLFKADVYYKINPHEQVKANKVEDIEIARLFKRNKHTVTCMTGDNSITCRMYNNFKEAVNGFSKNIASFFGGSLLLAFIFWFITSFGFIFIYFSQTLSVFIIYLLTLLAIRSIISKLSEQNVVQNILYMIPQQFTMGLIIYKAFLNRYINNYQWKGRSIK